MEAIEEYEDGEVHKVEGGILSGEVVVYQNWVHLPEWPRWLPREQVESVRKG